MYFNSIINIKSKGGPSLSTLKNIEHSTWQNLSAIFYVVHRAGSASFTFDTFETCECKKHEAQK